MGLTVGYGLNKRHVIGKGVCRNYTNGIISISDQKMRKLKTEHVKKERKKNRKKNNKKTNTKKNKKNTKNLQHPVV